MNRKQRRAETRQLRSVTRSGAAPVQHLFTAALQLHKDGNAAEAEALYRRVLAADPGHADSLHLLGLLAYQAGNHQQAEAWMVQAIGRNPSVAFYHSNLCNVFAALGRLDAAVASGRRALLLDPNVADAENNLGIVLAAQGLPAEAEACYRRALALRPDYPEAHNNLGIALKDQGRRAEAIGCYRAALALRPAYPDAYNNLGIALAEQGQADAAVACYMRALALRPDYPEALNNLGIALKEQGKLEEAVVCCRRAFQLRPFYAEAHNNLGNALEQLGQVDEAVASYRQAIGFRPDYPEAHTNLAMLLLSQGDLPAGWQEYEWRWTQAGMASERRGFTQPQWRGEAAAGRRLLIHAEQGFGDTLQFCRYGALAAARGLQVIMEVQPPLVRLLRGLDGVGLVVGRGEALPGFDLHCPMLSLPLALGTTVATIPAAAAYLHADAGQVAAWRQRLAATCGPGLRIGLVWAGGQRLHSAALVAVDRRRSMPPERLARLFDLPGCRFFSLQKGGAAAPAGFPLTDLMDEMADFADTAALIATLDLVISVDTAVAHLAAALGRPVWLLDRFDPCWRWRLQDEGSPWYPSVRLFRQTQAGDWGGVIERVRDALGRLAARTALAKTLPPP